MEKSKKFRMPAGIRNKLMAAIAMLLVSSIMMVSSTYAWFTLSTAPEVTGITTSVGANGNLEMALLNGQTYDNMSLIGSAVGDSSAAAGKTVEQSNITWGNLVDLSAAGYGLNLIALNPAALNYTDETMTAVGTTLLKTAVYGADGRVAELKDNTITGVYNSTNAKWVTNETIEGTSYPAYGVRAIGVDSSMTTAQIVFNAAVAAVNSGNRNASSATASAVAQNSQRFLLLAMALGENSGAEYAVEDIAALKAVAEGVQSSLQTIVNAYANAILANLATADLSDEELTLLRTKLSTEDNASDLIALLDDVDGVETSYTGSLADIAAAQGTVANVLTACGTYAAGAESTDTETVAAIKDNIVTPLIGSTVTALNANGGTETPSMNSVGDIKAIYVTGGLVATVAAEAGTYEMCRVTGFADLTVYAGSTDEGAEVGNLDTVAGLVGDLESPSGENAEQTIADFYGYVIDFAFRTNAASSNLQLQTSAVNRVYSDAEGENLATQGSGSTATFVFDSNLLTETQVNALLSAINLVFLNPADGTIYGTAKLTDVAVNGGEATAKVKMENQTGDFATIVALAQNQATKVSVLVYMDGNKIDNADVANSTSSGMLNLNLQFSSSAELIPMQNTALENLVAYTVSFNANGGFGFMPAVKASGDYTAPTNTFTAPTGKQFKGWSKTAEGTELITTSITLEENVTLYAIWEDIPDNGEDDETGTTSYTVTLHPNGGTGTAQTVNAAADGSYTLPTVYDDFTAPAGKVLGGWSRNAEGTEKITETTITVTENTTLYAVWVDAPAQPTATELTGVTLSGATLDGTATFVDKTISFKLNDGAENPTAIAEGTVIVTVGEETVPATCSEGTWSATVTGDLAANTAVTIAYTAPAG